MVDYVQGLWDVKEDHSNTKTLIKNPAQDSWVDINRNWMRQTNVGSFRGSKQDCYSVTKSPVAFSVISRSGSSESSKWLVPDVHLILYLSCHWWRLLHNMQCTQLQWGMIIQEFEKGLVISTIETVRHLHGCLLRSIYPGFVGHIPGKSLEFLPAKVTTDSWVVADTQGHDASRLYSLPCLYEKYFQVDCTVVCDLHGCDNWQ